MYNGNYKLGINLMGGSGLTVDEHVALLKRIGWDGFFTGWNREKLDEFREAAEKYGMVWQSIHAPFTQVRYMWNEGELGEQVTAELIECVKDCAAHNVPVMVVHPFIGFGEHDPTEAGLVNFGRLITVADELGVRLGFENVEGEEYLQAIFERYAGHPSLGFCFDTGHELCYNRGKDMLAEYGHALCHTHFNDNVGVTGKDIFWTDDLHLVMGDGIADWAGVMRRIRETGYDGPLMCEMSFSNKPDKHTHDEYAVMGHEKFYELALERMKHIVAPKDGL
ncbi:MAG: sugar phosphate isomerase/epimerase [Clostridia bacterium]|nr:sugar phosphate isomerase/epimerase [Clostridia bacterium]